MFQYFCFFQVNHPSCYPFLDQIIKMSCLFKTMEKSLFIMLYVTIFLTVTILTMFSCIFCYIDRKTPLMEDFIFISLCCQSLQRPQSCNFHFSARSQHPHEAFLKSLNVCMSVELYLPVQYDLQNWGLFYKLTKIPKKHYVFLLTQITQQQLQNLKMGIMQEQIMQVRFLLSKNHCWPNL